MRFKLNLLLFLIVTVVLVAASTFSYYSLRAELFARFDSRKEAVAKRLQDNLVNALWNIDVDQAIGIVDSELRSTDVAQITVFLLRDNASVLWFLRTRSAVDPDQVSTSAEILPQDVVRLPVYPRLVGNDSGGERRKSDAIGSVQIEFTREGLEKVLENQVRNQIALIIVLNVLLALTLFYAMRRMVIGPLAQLSDAFKELSHNPRSGGIKIKCEDEFAEIVVAFNQIEQRLVSDIDRRAEAEKRLRQSNEDLIAAQSQLLQSEKMAAIGQLAAGVAHEINNPIGFVNSNLGTLKTYSNHLLAIIEAYERGVAASTEQARQAADLDFLREDMPVLLNESQEGLNRVTKIVQDLKDYSRVNDAGRQLADLNAAMESTLNVVWNELKYKAEVIRELGNLPPVDCLPAQINQVFTNLLVNAAQAIPDRGKITIRSYQAGEMACFEIEDTGHGMTEEVRRRIFEPFFTTKPVGKGTGLGLSISYDIVVKKHGGRLEVSSEPGKGSCFRICLPLAFHDASAASGVA